MTELFFVVPLLLGPALALVAIVALVALPFVVSGLRPRYSELAVPSAGWVRTAEVFRDPASFRVMRVWLDHHGRRHYVPED